MQQNYPASSLRLTFHIICLSLLISVWVFPAVAKGRSASTSDPSYVEALITTNHFLQAWQSGDIGNEMALLTSHSKEKATTDVLENFFAATGTCAYEIGRGKLIRRGNYEFPVVLVSTDEKRSHVQRRFSTVMVIDTGHNDWAVDKLP
jgi:hypothetical protein